MSKVLNINEWAKEHKAFWEDAAKNGLRVSIVDTLIRHTWAEEQPEEDGEYLVRISIGNEISCKVVQITAGDTAWSNNITHWWHTPKVTVE